MWPEKDGALYRKFEFKGFKEAFTFMQEVAKAAEQQNHHPKWQNDWNKVEIWLTTHSAGNKVTEKDHKLAGAINKIFKTQNSKPAKPVLNEAKLYADGGSRGNPGESAGAFVICKTDDSVVEKSGIYLGTATNNQAEYKALIKGLDRAYELGIDKLQVYLDSELVVKQLNGQYKIKNNELVPLHKMVKDKSAKFGSVSFSYVPREMNKLADAEVNRILDKKGH